MNNWYEKLVKECETAHDKECEYGEECAGRTSHIERVFIRQALKERVAVLAARLTAVEKLHEKPPTITGEICTSCVAPGESWPEHIRKAVRGE